MKNWQLLSALICALAIQSVQAQQSRSFPNSNTGVRFGTPNDPNFDCNERDDEDNPSPPALQTLCDSVFASQKTLFGFAPDASELTARYFAVPDDATRQGIAVSDAQIAGSHIDRAWKVTVGRPEVKIAVLDTGINWDRASLFGKIFLNRAELPLPEGSAVYDKNSDGVFNVFDYEGDSRVPIDQNPNIESLRSILDVQDLILAFSDGTDADNNGYIDDISGWDFFEDDNDAEDVTSYSAASNHGTGRAVEAAANTNDGEGEAGVCPQCQIVPLREWDTFVVPGDNYAASAVYSAEIGADALVVANGVLQNTKAAQAATKYAHENGVALMIVSSDLNTANHNVPTNYVESVFINGCIADTETALGSEFSGGGFGISVPDTISTWFRESNVTQHGAHAHVCFNAVTGSQATGHAGGAAGLIHSAGLDAVDNNVLTTPLTTDEVKQLLTRTAEDVLPENTNGVGVADPANRGWDEYFGYGRANVGLAAEDVAAGRIPPVVQITKPAWWHILDPGATATGATVDIEGRVSASRSASCSYQIEWAAGVSPLDANMQVLDGQSGIACNDGVDGILGSIPLDTIAAAFAGSRTGGQTAADFNQYVFTVRILATDADGVIGDDRKTYFIYHDPTWHDGWPLFVDTGGESSAVLYDMDGNGTLEVIEANSSGELHVRQHDGTALPGFNNGSFWQLPPAFYYHPGSNAFTSGAVPPLTSGFRTPAIADIDDDFEPEIVAASADGRVFVLEQDGSVKLELGLDLSLSTPDLRSRRDHPKRGILGAPVIADLDPNDGHKDIIVAALDGHIYVWHPITGALRSGFPKQIQDDTSGDPKSRGELIATPAVADLNNDGVLEIITSSSEVFSADPQPPGQDDIPSNIGDLVANVIANSAGATSRVYALDINGNFLSGWPVSLPGLLPDILPFVGPQHGVAVADFNGDGNDEVVASVTSGDVHLIQPDGSAVVLGSQGVPAGGSVPTAEKILNLFEYYAVGDLDGAGGLDIATGGVTAGYAVDLLISGQNSAFDHVVQVWDSSSVDNYLTGYPAATDDMMLLSTPIIGDVDATGTGDTREVIVGNGLYLIHAYGPNATEPPGFPKLTGGWNFSVPAIGDIDGDGLLEMAGGTREGFRFVWDLTGQATVDAVGQWPMEGHDECNSNNYGIDCAPPSPVQNLMLSGQLIQLTAPGDNWNIGTPNHYQRRTSETPILNATDWNAATAIDDLAATQAAGGNELFSKPSSNAYIAVVAVDEAGNRSRIRSIQYAESSIPPNGLASGSSLGDITIPVGPAQQAGSFTLQNTSRENQTVRALTITLTEENDGLSLIQSLELTPNNQSPITIQPISASNRFVLGTAITLEPGESLSFNLEATAPGALTSNDYHFFAPAHATEHNSGRNISAAAIALLLMLLGLAITRGKRLLGISAMSAILLVAGCGGGGQTSPSAPATTTQTPPTGGGGADANPRSVTVRLTGVEAENPFGSQVSYGGLPLTLSKVVEESSTQQ